MKLNKLIRHLTFLFLAASAFAVSAQVPFIRSISKNIARPQETITIQGINFGTNASNIKVMFGNVSATPQTISDQYLEVNVPYGATYQDINVINTSTGLSGAYKVSFLSSYGGTNPFDITALLGQFDFASESGLYDLATADFDGDGKLDVVTANNNALNISVFLNTSSSGTASFTKSLLTPGVNTLHPNASDLNGDGKPDILVSELNGSRIFIFQNNSTIGSISFAAPLTLTVPGSKVSQISVQDMDLNGKVDLIVTDQAASRVFFVTNQSTLATIQFAAPVSISFGGAVTDGLAVGDLDGDALPEIVASEFLSANGNIFILKNTSTLGTLSFGNLVKLSAGTSVSGLRIGDLDGDAKPELAATAVLISTVMIYGNQSTSSSIQFAAPVLINANMKPWGLDFGDMDGDGKTDIAVASITQKAVTVLNNNSTAGNFSFQTLTIPTTYINRHIKINDLDNDGRPDLSFTSIDDNNLNIPASKISVFLNRNCVIPKLTPNGPITICSGYTQRLTASSSPGSTYEWFNNGVSMGAPGAASFLDVTATGVYTVRLVNGSCTQTSSSVSITAVATGAYGAVTPTSNTPVCVAGTLNLSVNDVGATDYVWTGPAFATPAHGVSVTSTNFQSSQVGEYTVTVVVGTCTIQQASVIVNVVDIPNAEVIFTGAGIICAGQTKLYSIFPSVTGYSYQWSEQTTGDIAGATGPTYTASVSGNYFVKLTSTLNPTCPAISTPAKSVRVAAIPVVNFSIPSTACTNQPVTFTDQSTVDSDTTGLHVNYSWDFGDSGSSTVENASHTYTLAQSFNVKLTVSYIGQSCPASLTQPITLQSLPALSISSASGIFNFCPSDSLLLKVTGTYDTYSWSNGAATSSTYIKQADTVKVTVTLGACKVSASQAVAPYAVNVVASANPKTIHAGDTTHLSVTGLVTYLWRPNKSSLSDSLIANPIAWPPLSAVYTVTGTDANGCNGQATVDITVFQNNAINTLHPTNFFSPNGDNINDTWQVTNAPNLAQCGVVVYDERGFKVYEAKPYLNNWNGMSSRGNMLPAGVYYYIIKCDDSGSDYLAGSINVVR